mmetsp:Transcript_32202/g.68510  ORF Transcript_32202/g.68510 Transcript_32202/m.68510 type:complete len:218 (+) Transcript_32202:125-778(+)
MRVALMPEGEMYSSVSLGMPLSPSWKKVFLKASRFVWDSVHTSCSRVHPSSPHHMLTSYGPRPMSTFWNPAPMVKCTFFVVFGCPIANASPSCQISTALPTPHLYDLKTWRKLQGKPNSRAKPFQSPVTSLTTHWPLKSGWLLRSTGTTSSSTFSSPAGGGAAITPISTGARRRHRSDDAKRWSAARHRCNGRWAAVAAAAAAAAVAAATSASTLAW